MPADAPAGDPDANLAVSSAERRALIVGECFSRVEIRTLFGGGVHDDLPHCDGRVVCGCFDPELNPAAPTVVLPGFGVSIERWADVFALQRNFVPCFLKRDTSVWEFVGSYRVRMQSRDATEVAGHANAVNRPGDVSSILYLDREA